MALNKSDGMKYVSLSAGTKLPIIGFGPGIFQPGYKKISNPWSAVGIFKRLQNKYFIEKKSRQNFINGIASAIDSGFRLIDYSHTYGGFPLLRTGIARSGVSRNELFLTTRIGNREQMKGIEEVHASFMRDLEAMQTDHFDLLQFHWPVTGFFENTWLEMIRLREEGLVKTLGVANCHQHHLERLHDISGEWPIINQVEVHPLFTQKPLAEFCQSKGITIEAYTPIARFDDRLVRLPLLKKIGQKYGKTLVQVVLRWHIQNGIIPIVRAMNPAHQKSNLDIFDFELTPEEMSAIDGININSRLRYDPDNCDFSIL